MEQSLAINNMHMEDVNIAICGYQHCKPGHFYGPAIRTYYLFHYILDGQGRFQAEGKTYALKAGQGFLIFPEYSTYYEADGRQPWTYVWLGIEGARVEGFLRQAGLSQQTPIFSTEKNSEVHQSFQQIYERVKKNENSELSLLGYSYHILDGLCRAGKQSILSRPQLYVNKTVNYINSNYHLPISVEQAAEMIGIDRKYLCSIFKKYMGISPSKYILKVKVQKACEMLKNTSNNVGDIARSVGYEDIFSFSRMFSNCTSLSPTGYRRSQQAK